MSGGQTGKERVHRIARRSVVLVLVVFLWFVLVDWSWFVETCPLCGYSRDVAQYRFAGVALCTSTRESHYLREKVARELGTPCSHGDMTSWHKHRWWGLCYCAGPCINGICGIAEEPEQDELILARVRKKVQADPGIRQQFQQRFIEDHDLAYWRDFLTSLPAD